jgi:hypothetical protein
VLHLLDETFEAVLRERGGLPAQEIDVSFEAPDRTWGARITRPTISAFLWQIRRCESQQSGSRDEVRDGRLVRVPTPPRFEFHYLVTAWASEPADQHRLLGSALHACATTTTIGDELLRGPFVGLRPPARLTVASSTQGAPLDLWSSLQSPLRVGLAVVLEASYDTQVVFEAGPPVERVEIRVADGRGATESVHLFGGEVDDPEAVGVPVLSPHGWTRVGADGRYTVAARPGDEITIETRPPRVVVVPGGAPIPTTLRG